MSSIKVKIGKVVIGGGEPIAVQSMLKTDPHDISSSLRQLRKLERSGCDLLRMAIPDELSLETFRCLKQRSSIPLIADIHFHPQLALKAIQAGADKVRINPGNIPKEGLKEILRVSKGNGIPLRVGFNSGSLPAKFRNIRPLWKGLLLAAEDFLNWVSRFDFSDLVFSLKASTIEDTVEAYRDFSQRFPFPLHLGLTEAGPIPEGVVKSTIALYSLLKEGIGDTIRISLTSPPEVEVQAAFSLLDSLGLRKKNLTLISCPTCGRAHSSLYPLIKMVRSLENEVKKPMVVAVMGCEVNGPGEASHADFGISLTQKGAAIFKKGKIVKRVSLKEIPRELAKELKSG